MSASFGFTDKEVSYLCDRNHIDKEQIRILHDGRKIGEREIFVSLLRLPFDETSFGIKRENNDFNNKNIAQKRDLKKFPGRKRKEKAQWTNKKRFMSA